MAGDIALRVLLSAETGTAISAMNFLGSSVKNIFSGMAHSVSNLSFGFRMLQTDTGLATEIIQQNASKLVLGLGQLALLLGTVAAVAAVGIGIKAVKAAGDFQSSMTRLVTSAGELPKNLKMVSAGILQMSVDTATSTAQLAAGMYYVESSGKHGADALMLLQAAAQGAKSENADLMTVTKALTTVMTDYHLPVTQSTGAMNGLIVAVQNGKTSLQDLSSSMGAVLPIASSLHISFPQVAGAMDTMTNAGMSARQAAQNLGHVLLALSAPSGVATKSMASVGLSAQQVKDALVHQGLPEALQLIEDHVGKEFPKGSVQYETALKNILGGIVGFKTASMLTGQSLKDTQAHIDAITGAMGNSKGAVLGFDDVQKTFNFHLDQAKEAWNTLLIIIGTKLLPILGNLLGAITPVVTAFTNWISSGHAAGDVAKWISDHMQVIAPIVAGLATAIGALVVTALPGLVAGFWLWASGAAAAAIDTIAATWPVLLLIAAVAGLVAIFIALYQHNAGFKAFVDGLVQKLQQLWQTIVANVVPAFQQAASWVQTVLVPALQQLWKTIVTNVVPVIQQIATWIQTVLIPALQQAATWIATHFVAAWQSAVTWFQGTFLPAMQRVGTWFMTNIWPVLVQIGQFIVTNFVPVWQQLVTTWQNQLLPSLLTLWGVLQNQIIPIFKSMWQIFQAQILPVLQQAWTLIQGQLAPIFKTLWQAIQPMLPQLQQVATIIGGVLLVVLVLLVGLIAGAVAGFATFLSGLIQFIGGVVQFVSGFVQVVAGILKLIWDLMTGNFKGIASDLQAIWLGIQNMWNGLWTAISGFTKMTVDTVVGFFKTFFSTVVGIFTNLYNTLVGHSIVPDMINGIVNWFAGLPGKVANFVSNMVSNIISKFGSMASQAIAKVAQFAGDLGSKFGSMASQAVSWGSTIINQFLSGLQAAWGAVTNWLGGALNSIRNMFPHSPVKAGPLMGLEHWGGNIVDNLIGSMRSGLPQLTSAANEMALAIGNPLGSSFAVKGGSFALQGKTTVMVQVQPAEISIDKRKLGDVMFTHQASELRKQGTIRNR